MKNVLEENSFKMKINYELQKNEKDKRSFNPSQYDAYAHSHFINNSFLQSFFVISILMLLTQLMAKLPAAVPPVKHPFNWHLSHLSFSHPIF